MAHPFRSNLAIAAALFGAVTLHAVAVNRLFSPSPQQLQMGDTPAPLLMHRIELAAEAPKEESAPAPIEREQLKEKIALKEEEVISIKEPEKSEQKVVEREERKEVKPKKVEPPPKKVEPKREPKRDLPKPQERPKPKVEERPAPSKKGAQGDNSAKGPPPSGRAGISAPTHTLSDSEVRFLQKPIPSYPRMAERRRMQGTATIVVTINRDGRATNARVERSSGHKLLDDEALKAALKIRTQPYRVSGEAVSVTVRTRYEFRL